ncbi:MAG: phosphoribosylanthranilate isomerase [Chloroflexota bacterium]|nr:phosphoribosylanthranilate isomerase [Chloroflexota bacterium]
MNTANGPASGLVKICGLRQPEHAVVAAGAGADLLGFIFAPARRRITPEAARQAIAAAKATTGTDSVLAVGVFVDAGPDEINEVIRLAGLDLVQLHGDEPPAMLSSLNRPVIKAFRPPPGTPADAIEPLLARFRAVANAPLLFLIDGYVADAAGGAGARADWSLASDLASSWPVSLAGGLTAVNVGAAIGTVMPAAVDVSSGVETAGEKDPVKIVEFIAGAKRAFAESMSS